ncbi:MAG: hypothetical protein ACTSXL_05465 [Alphaproteobacteria bacterium]|nr:MAG: hypothetical protein B6I23_00570 [Rickettsiaceae bacterium 4572_127]
MNNILKLLTKKEILKIFDKKAIEVIEHYLKLNSFSHPEAKTKQKNLKFQTTKEHMEQWVVQAIGGEPLGAGSYPVDIKTDSFLADIKSMSIKLDKNGLINNSESGETSLGQKFKEKNLDEMFVNKEYEKLKRLWIKILKDKYKKAIDDTGIKKIYFIFLMRADKDYYLLITKLNYKNISEKTIQVDSKRTSEKSVFLNNFIDKKYGSVKIYQSKKRLELRLLPKNIIDNSLYYKFKSLHYPNKKDLRFIDLKKHLKEKIKKFFTVFF